jgi:phage baseplate assembly protein W
MRLRRPAGNHHQRIGDCDDRREAGRAARRFHVARRRDYRRSLNRPDWRLMAEEFSAPFLGTGWEFPPAFVSAKEKSTVAMVPGRVDIEQSLEILLSTLPGERIMQPRYGCDLTPMLFEPLTTSLITDISDRIRTAILYFEPRILAENIRVTPDEALSGRILIEITYRIAATNSRHNFVFPFYKEEGSEIQ